MRARRRAQAVVVALVAVVGLLTGGAAHGATSGASKFAVTTISTPSPVYGTAVDSEAHRAYVVVTDDPGVLIIDTRSDEVLERLAIEGFTGALAIDPELHRLYAALSDKRLAVIDTETRSVVRVARLGFEPGPMVLDPSTHQLWVNNERTLRVVDPARSRVLRATIRLDGWANQVAIDPVGHRAYLTYLDLDGVTVIDTTTATLRSTFGRPYGLSSVGVDTASRRLYVAGWTGPVRVMTLPGRHLVATIADPDPSLVTGFGFDPRLHLTYFVHSLAGSTVSVVDTRRHRLLASVPTGIAPSIGVDTETHRAFVPAYEDTRVFVITPGRA